MTADIFEFHPKPSPRTIGDILTEAADKLVTIARILFAIVASDKLDVASIRIVREMIVAVDGELARLVPSGGRTA